VRVLGFGESLTQARALAERLGCPCDEIHTHRFPDGESRVCVPCGGELVRPIPAASRRTSSPLQEHAILYRSLDYPNDKLIELLLAARTLREQGYGRLTLVAPYLCYMRQDTAFQPGEAVSQRHIGVFLAGLFDAVVTVDPHLHRIQRLEQAIPLRRAVAVSAAPLFGALLRQRTDRPLLFGPDGESAQWVEVIARLSGLEGAVARKERLGDRQVDIRMPDVALAGRCVVLVDDVASTGHTLAAVARELYAAGAARVEACITHALFAGDALEVLRAAGIEQIVSSDSIPHPSNRVTLAPLLAQTLHGLFPDRLETDRAGHSLV
jgi:ribose-phosphate pyrophosphokinase